MGVPKFFRWVSERYPVCSQLVEENRIPQFDNLYLDMNGIIHQCSHSNDAEIDFKLPEDVVFEKICLYVDKLFFLIQPQKVFFMAIDGVAPRAKMNQQRSRRFRSSQENAQKRQDAEETQGCQFQDEDMFDSNCITPGTQFMQQLSVYFNEFIQDKMFQDPLWQKVKVIFSGHNVPGEGEHKIMDYIRWLKSQPTHDPNTRHCLYGLDADLIMLSLVTHEPHFALLREEVKFFTENNKDKKATTLMKQTWVDSADQQRYYLMHISLLREYLDLEFQRLKPDLNEDYNLVALINDFILLCIFIGNDFLPHLPHLHIHDSALTYLLDIYKEVLKEARHYINVEGKLHLPTLSLLFEKMIQLEQDALTNHLENEGEDEGDEFDDFNSERDIEEEVDFSLPQVDDDEMNDELLSKLEDESNEEEVRSRSITPNASIRSKETNGLKAAFKKFQDSNVNQRITVPNVISPMQKALTEFFLKFISSPDAQLTFESNDRFFIMELCSQINLDVSEPSPGKFILTKKEDLLTDSDSSLPLNSRLKHLPMRDEFGNDIGPRDPIDVLYEYLACPVGDPNAFKGKAFNGPRTLEDSWKAWKMSYYTKKLQFDLKDIAPQVHKLTTEYIRGLQWVLSYYYDGVASWSWFFPYYYTPFISDLAELDLSQVDLTFDLGTPFTPFEQLFAVLPIASGRLLPDPLHELMFDPSLEYYFPKEFETDLNGKKNEWEKVIKIPFIDQDLFVQCIRCRLHLLTEEELERNQFGDTLLYQYIIASSNSPSHDPHSTHSGPHCDIQAFHIDKPTTLRKGICEGCKPSPGFPSLLYVETSYRHAYHRVNVFGRASKNQSIVIQVFRKEEDDPFKIASELINQRVYYQWPYLIYGLVEAVGKGDTIYYRSGRTRLMEPDEQNEFLKRRKVIDKIYYKERGIIVPPIQIMLFIRKFKHMRKTKKLRTICEFAERAQWVPWDLVLPEVPFIDPRVQEQDALPLPLEYPLHAEVYLLNSRLSYGAPGRVARLDVENEEIDGHFLLFSHTRPLDFGHRFIDQSYYSLSELADHLELSTLLLSKLTSSILVSMGAEDAWNLGLNVKFSNQGLMVLGYTRYRNGHWEFSQRCFALIRDFVEHFPWFIRSIAKSPKQAVYIPFDFHNSIATAKQQLSKVKAWLQELPPLPTISYRNQLMCKDEIVALEKALASHHSKHSSSSTNCFTYIRHVPLSSVLKPEHAVFRLTRQSFCLGDRVLTISSPGRSCVGTYGYVVGILEDGRIQVRQDTSFRGGTDLGTRCEPNHGITLQSDQLLNLTTPFLCPHNHPTPTSPLKNHYQYTQSRSSGNRTTNHDFRSSSNMQSGHNRPHVGTIFRSGFPSSYSSPSSHYDTPSHPSNLNSFSSRPSSSLDNYDTSAASSNGSSPSKSTPSSSTDNATLLLEIGLKKMLNISDSNPSTSRPATPGRHSDSPASYRSPPSSYASNRPSSSSSSSRRKPQPHSRNSKHSLYNRFEQFVQDPEFYYRQ